jgi:hypothetical protein
MVTTEIEQLSGECNAWRETLRSLRDEFTNLKSQLPAVASQETSKDILLEIDHLDNQLHIQLINIHDLKHAIKTHHRKINFETNQPGSSVTEETLAEHEKLHDEFESLSATLEELRSEFERFMAHT